MYRWVVWVTILYVLALMSLTMPLLYVALKFPDLKWAGDIDDFMGVLQARPYWAWLGVMALAQGALLLLPMKIASKRPMTRMSVFFPVAAVGLMMGGLLLGATFCVIEYVTKATNIHDAWMWFAFGTAALTWIVWSMVFYRQGRQMKPPVLLRKQRNSLIAGSVLELMIAVPTHIVARHRDYCCAGFMTFVGLSMGISVMLFAFGPSVYFLYADRWRRVKGKKR